MILVSDFSGTSNVDIKTTINALTSAFFKS